jgi:hypothetical protein
MAAKQALQAAGAEKREDWARDGALCTQAEFAERYGEAEGGVKWNEAEVERRVDTADGRGYTRLEFLDESVSLFAMIAVAVVLNFLRFYALLQTRFS